MNKGQELKLKFFPRPEYIHKIFDIIEELLDIVVLDLDKEKRQEFIIALREALDNAITHGNKYAQNKFIEIECFVSRDQIVCSVQDEGKGFDYKSYVAQPLVEFEPKKLIQKASEGQLGGLGLALIRKCTDGVYFNEIGNKIYFIKRLTPSPQETLTEIAE